MGVGRDWWVFVKIGDTDRDWCVFVVFGDEDRYFWVLGVAACW